MIFKLSNPRSHQMVNRVLFIIPIIVLIFSFTCFQDVYANKPTITTEAQIYHMSWHEFLPHTIIKYNYTASSNANLNTLPLVSPHATLTYHMIDVMRSQVCNIEESHNMTSGCPTLKELAKFDTSNQDISGKFIPGPHGDYIRTPPQVKQNWMFYSSDVVCIECQTNLFNPDVIQEIFVEPHSFTFVNKTDVLKNTNIFTSFQSVAFQGCNTATLAYDQQIFNQTIKYFESNCSIPMPQINKTNITSYHDFLPKDSVQWRYNQYLNDVANQTLGNCINTDCHIKSYGNKFHS